MTPEELQAKLAEWKRHQRDLPGHVARRKSARIADEIIAVIEAQAASIKELQDVEDDLVKDLAARGDEINGVIDSLEKVIGRPDDGGFARMADCTAGALAARAAAKIESLQAELDRWRKAVDAMTPCYPVGAIKNEPRDDTFARDFCNEIKRIVQEEQDHE